MTAETEPAARSQSRPRKTRWTQFIGFAAQIATILATLLGFYAFFVM
jgi:hypothetical protein